MNRILTTATLALALFAPVAAQAGIDEITAANFNERYAAVVTIIAGTGAKWKTTCYAPEQGGGCTTTMGYGDVPTRTYFAVHQFKKDGVTYSTSICARPIDGENRLCVYQTGDLTVSHTVEHIDSAAGVWRTVKKF
jgi:hypothetical protein